MKLIKPSFEILQFDDNKLIELAGRTCYKSEDKIAEGTCDKFAALRIKEGHEAMIEFGHATVKIVCDRGVSHEIVRHRLFSFAQESTRYCNYAQEKFGNECTFIIPPWIEFTPKDNRSYSLAGSNDIFEKSEYSTTRIEIGRINMQWLKALNAAENAYFDLLADGWKPQQARAVLSNSLKTEIICKANFREWRHFFKMRDDSRAHPQMQEIAKPLHEEFARRNPFVFGG